VAAPLPGLAARLIGRQALDNPVAGKHASVDGEVPADHKGTHGCVFLGQRLGLVGKIRLVLPPIDQDQARVAIGVPVGLVQGVMPSTPPAEACKSSSVSPVARGSCPSGLDTLPRLCGKSCQRLGEEA
jgi:hypothetical protein